MHKVHKELACGCVRESVCEKERAGDEPVCDVRCARHRNHLAEQSRPDDKHYMLSPLRVC